MKYCIYYDNNNYEILDYLPKNIEATIKNSINEFWTQDIPRKILVALSRMDKTTIPELKENIGHSMSTLHENISKLEQAGLIKTEITYVQNKKKNIIPLVLAVTKNPENKIKFKKFFQGLWIDSKKTQKIIDFLNKNGRQYFTAEQISVKTRIPVDEIEMLLGNWDSLSTRTLSNIRKECPFEKKVLYKGNKRN